MNATDGLRALTINELDLIAGGVTGGCIPGKKGPRVPTGPLGPIVDGGWPPIGPGGTGPTYPIPPTNPTIPL